MSSQTKLGFITVILLVGCIFAIPHFRHPLAEPESADSSPIEPEVSLRRKKSEPVPSDLGATPPKTKTKTTKTDSDLAVGVAESRSLTSKRSLTSTRQTKPSSHPAPSSLRHEQWKFPPVDTFRETAGQATGDSGLPSDRSDRSDRPRPIRIPLPPASDANLAERRATAAGRRTPPANWDGARLAQANAEERQAFPSRRTNVDSTTPRGRTASIGRQQFVERQPGMPTGGEASLHRIVNGDTLENLAMQYYGDTQKAILIFDSNRSVLLNPAILPLGVDLKIPSPNGLKASR